jgi:hypothetical protein
VLTVAACVVAGAVGAGVSWLYFSEDGDAPPQAAVTARTAPGAGVAMTPPAVPNRGLDSAEDADLGRRLEARLADVTGALSAMNARIAALETTVRDSTDAARAAAARADRAIAAFDETTSKGNERDTLDRGALDDLQTRLRTLESLGLTMQQVQDRLDQLSGAPDKPVRSALTADALRNAVERDRPFAAELAAARTVGLDAGALAALSPFAVVGLPRPNLLLRELSALLPELRQAVSPPGDNLGYLDRLKASAARMLQVRRVTDDPGDDPAAVLSTVEFKMAHDDIDAVITQLDRLPPNARAVVAPWRARAVARRQALEAVRTLAASTLAGLGSQTSGGSTPQ